MNTERRLSAPGRLAVDDEVTDTAVVGTELPSEPLAELAAKYKLKPSAERPPMLTYLRSLWRRWNFILAFATARNIAMYTEARLGQLWQVLTPLLNAGVYYFIFGIILGTSRGIPDFVSFLVTGVFVFNFTQRAFISSSSVITNSLPLIRALQFPRASLPLAYVVIELQQMLLSMAVLVVIVLAAGEPLTLYWLLAIPALLLQTIFNVGVGLTVARAGAQVSDFSQLADAGEHHLRQALPRDRGRAPDQPGRAVHHAGTQCPAEIAAAEPARRDALQRGEVPAVDPLPYGGPAQDPLLQRLLPSGD